MSESRWSHQDILKAVRLKGWTQGRIAQVLELSPSGVSYAIRTGSSLKVCAFIAELIAVEERILWGNRFPSPWREGEPPPLP